MIFIFLSLPGRPFFLFSGHGRACFATLPFFGFSISPERGLLDSSGRRPAAPAEEEGDFLAGFRLALGSPDVSGGAVLVWSVL